MSKIIANLIAPTGYLILIAFGLIQLLFRWITATLFGALLSSCVLYFAALKYSDTKPFDLDQLAIYANSLAIEMKSAIITSVITIIGFIAAFSTTATAWKYEWKAKYKLDIAEMFEDFFAEAARLTNDIRLIAEGLIKAKDGLKKAKHQGTTRYHLISIYEDQQKIRSLREKVSAMHIQSFSLLTRHAHVLAGDPLAHKLAKQAKDALAVIADEMWFPVPFFTDIDSANIDGIVAELEGATERHAAAAKNLDDQSVLMAATSAGLKSRLTEKTIGSNLYNLRYAASLTPMVADISIKLREARRKSKRDGN